MPRNHGELEEMIRRMQAGDIAPGSAEGQETIRQLAQSGPREVTRKLYSVPNEMLEKGMKAAGLSENAIEDAFRTDRETVDNPFGDGFEPEKPETEPAAQSPFLIDPSAEIARGPRRR